jgi:hypothetical protein
MDEKQLEEVLNAKRQVIEGNLVLWRTRMATLTQIGGAGAAVDLIQKPVEPADAPVNANFGSGTCCPAPPRRPGGVVIPGEPTITTLPPPGR